MKDIYYRTDFLNRILNILVRFFDKSVLTSDKYEVFFLYNLIAILIQKGMKS